jgi:hypothetical protein
MELSAKQEQFNHAMERYNSGTGYRILGKAVSSIIISLQGYLLLLLWPHSIGVSWQLFALLSAYLLTDFINGLVHMYMDNNDAYGSLFGPLIANFHLHHKVPLYRKNNLLMVYFTESGSKIWLVFYLLGVFFVHAKFEIEATALYILVYFGILSSIAEVSHYLCHTSRSSLARFLASCGLLLSKRHHSAHHLHDNNNYAFLNGCSDPLLNLIAAACCTGYKNNTDLHYATYADMDSEER